MLKLPFKIQPKAFEIVAIGNDEIGILELPKLQDLSPNERIFIRESMNKSVDLREEAVKIARVISQKSNIPLLEVYNALTTSNTETLSDYLEDFLKFQSLVENHSEHRELVLATVMLRRLVSEWKIENTGDSAQIHPKLVQLVAEFAAKEESGWTVEQSALTEEDLGKQEKTRTGKKSSGASKDTGGETIALVATTSDSSQPG